jgi:PAS domain S-box-containing protein
MKEEYQLLLDSISDYAIYRLDLSGRVSSWNTGAERMKGYASGEILGKHFSVFFTDEDRDQGKPENELLFALRNGRYEEEAWRVRKDGGRFWANVIVTPVFTESGEHAGYAKVTRDLTEKRRSEEIYHLLVSQVKEYAIFMMDVNGNILTWNEGAARIKGYTAPEIIGKHFSVFYNDVDKKEGKPERGLKQALANGKFEDEGWRIKKDGSTFWANVVITPIYKDKHIGFAKVTQDLTEKKELEKITRANVVLEAKNKELELFASITSHDLKEPLRKIITFANLMLEGDNENKLAENHREYGRKIISAAKKMDRLIQDILSFSILSKQDHFEKCSLKEVISDTLDTLEQAIRERNASIICSELPDAVIIPSQMRQLFQNLISNALKFSKKDISPQISITHEVLRKQMVKSENLWPSEEYLLIKLRDNGIGFDQEHAQQIFSLFGKLHHRSIYEGSGLGLAICKKIAENHGGTIVAQSSPGEGAEFTLLIPG